MRPEIELRFDATGSMDDAGSRALLLIVALLLLYCGTGCIAMLVHSEPFFVPVLGAANGLVLGLAVHEAGHAAAHVLLADAPFLLRISPSHISLLRPSAGHWRDLACGLSGPLCPSLFGLLVAAAALFLPLSFGLRAYFVPFGASMLAHLAVLPFENRVVGEGAPMGSERR